MKHAPLEQILWHWRLESRWHMVLNIKYHDGLTPRWWQTYFWSHFVCCCQHQHQSMYWIIIKNSSSAVQKSIAMFESISRHKDWNKNMAVLMTKLSCILKQDTGLGFPKCTGKSLYLSVCYFKFVAQSIFWIMACYPTDWPSIMISTNPFSIRITNKKFFIHQFFLSHKKSFIMHSLETTR